MPPRLEIQPQRSRVDEDLAFVITGADPGAILDIEVSVQDGALREWCSHATFRVDSEGIIDLRRQAPLPGSSWSGVDPLGPLWSMTPKDPSAFFTRTRAWALTYHAVIRHDGKQITETTFTRHFGDEVCREEVHQGPIVGTIHRPDDDQPRPGVILLAGSDGANLEAAGSLLAGHGYTVLSLNWFKAEGRPPDLVRIPLEDLDAAVDYLAGHPFVSTSQIALIGLSRGAELALQVAADHAGVGLVVAGAPSSIRQPGVTANYRFDQPAWIRDGKPLGFVPAKGGAFSAALGWLRSVILGRPMRQRQMFLTALRRSRPEAEIEVERIRGPIVLISGLDDGLWPSADYAQRIVQRLRSRGWQGQVRDERIPRAGHFVAFPYAIASLPAMIQITPSPRFTIDFGGDPEGNAQAASRSWGIILDALSTWAAEERLSPAT